MRTEATIKNRIALQLFNMFAQILISPNPRSQNKWSISVLNSKQRIVFADMRKKMTTSNGNGIQY